MMPPTPPSIGGHHPLLHHPEGALRMSRIVLLIEHVENRRLLAECLSVHHDVVIPGCPHDLSLDARIDLVIVDSAALEHHGRWLDAIKHLVHPLFLPLLLITSQPPRG